MGFRFVSLVVVIGVLDLNYWWFVGFRFVGGGKVVVSVHWWSSLVLVRVGWVGSLMVGWSVVVV